MSQDGTEVIEHVAAQNRFTITVDGTQAGFAAYRDTELGRAFDHTEVDPAFGGRGLAGKVVAVALDEAVEAGRPIIPSCSYVAKYVTKHPEYLAHVPERTRAAMNLPDPA